MLYRELKTFKSTERVDTCLNSILVILLCIKKWAWLGLGWDSNQKPPEAVTPLLGQVSGKKPGMYDKSRHAFNADIFFLV